VITGDADEDFNFASEGKNQITITNDLSSTTLYFYRAKSVLFYLIQRSNQNNLRKYVNLIATVVGLVRGYLPTCIFFWDWKFFPGKNVEEKITFTIVNVNLFIFYWYITKFILQSVLDFQRKTFLMEQLRGMITPERTAK
jgi:hypothetical protein